MVTDFLILLNACLIFAIAGCLLEPRLRGTLYGVSTAYQRLVRSAEVRDARCKIRDQQSWWFKRRKVDN